MSIENQALEFVRHLFELCFEKRDFESFLQLLNEDVSWIGAQAQESAQGLAQMRALLGDLRSKGFTTVLKLDYPQYSAKALDAEICLVQGRMGCTVQQTTTQASPQYGRFSALCKRKGEGMELLQAHISASLQNNAQKETQHNKIEELQQLIVAQKKELALSEKRYELVIQYTNMIVFDYIPSTKQTFHSEWNAKKYNIPRVMENAVETVAFSGSIHPDSIQTFLGIFERMHAGMSFSQGTIAVVDYNGKEALKELCLTALPNEEGSPVHVVGILTDVTEVGLLEKEKQYRRAMTSDKILAFEANISKNTVEHINDSWANMLDVPMIFDFYLLITYMECHVLHPDFAQAYGEFFARDTLMDALENGKASCALEYRRKDRKNVYSWVQSTVHIIRDETNGDVRLRCYTRNIDEEKEKELDLIYRARHDVLTGLLNKSTTEQAIDDYLATPEGKNGCHCFFIFDVDFFKSSNDNCGHAFGDKVLAHVGTKVRSLFRTDDIMGRVGGDEFVLLMKQAPKQNHVQEKAKELCRTMAETYSHNHKEQSVSVSIGIAVYCEHGTNYQQLYKNADKALYRAKAEGKNRFCLYREVLFEAESS